jgi:hypothetical protein
MDAKDYAIVTLDVHGDRQAPIQALLTRDEASALSHRNQPATVAAPAAASTTVAAHPQPGTLPRAPTPAPAPASTSASAPATILASTPVYGALAPAPYPAPASGAPPPFSGPPPPTHGAAGHTTHYSGQAASSIPGNSFAPASYLPLGYPPAAPYQLFQP